MFLVVTGARLERSEWERLTEAAKGADGWYSRQWGKTPGGWAFWSAEAADAFLAAHFQPVAAEACGTCVPDCGCGTCPAARVG